MEAGPCAERVVFTGQIGNDMVPDGGNPTLDPYPADFQTGIRSVLRAVPVEEGQMPVDMHVRRARVTATNYYTDNFEVPPSQSRFWIEDADGAVELYLDFRAEGTTPPFPIRVGQSISLRVTEVGRFGPKPQIIAATDWILVSVDRDVSIFEPNRAFEIADIQRLVRVTGTLVGEGEICDRPDAEQPNRCWELDYGYGDPVVFRSRSPLVGTGVCITFVGPLGWYEGRPHLDTINYSWLMVNDPID